MIIEKKHKQFNNQTNLFNNIMKKYLNFAFLSAIALAGTCCFTACSDSEGVLEQKVTEQKDVNPTNSVNTQFVLNVATSASATRSSATDVQQNNNFRGMDNVKLFAFNTGTKKAVQKDNVFGAFYDLDKLLAQGSVTADASNRIVNINIPIGTDAFLFYGKAMKGENTDDTEGKIDYDVSITSDGKLQTKFSLQSRASTTDRSVLKQTEDFVADIINALFSPSHTYTKDGASETTTMTMLGLGAQYAEEKDKEANLKTMTPLELSLGEAFYRISTIGSTEFRAGCADAILSTMADLKTTLKTVTAATPTGTQETAAKALAELVNTKFATFFNWNTSTGEVTFNDASALKGTADLSTNWGSNTTITDAILGGFPQYFGLPAGCSLLTYDTTTKKFKYKNSAGTNILEQALYNRDKVMFPAELTYYCNGPIRTSNTDRMTSGYPNGTTNWTTDAQWTGDWTAEASAVTSSTRAAALIPNVNYGVAMLQSRVKLADVENFEDNRYANTGEDDQLIAKANVKLKLTGIIIGGQCPQVGWDFLRRQADDDFNYMIYDNRIAGYAKGAGVAIPTDGGTSADNYTLVFDNYRCGTTIADAGAQTDQNDVNVALEFVNEGDDFWGQGNLVRKGTTFYLLAMLPKPTTEQAAAFQWPSTAATGNVNRFYEVPPIDNTGVSRKIARVFVQDYKTTATFVIGAKSLQNALVTVPDLRSTQMSFGLSVDLTWKSGITYDNISL